jgi:hypothetical protein
VTGVQAVLGEKFLAAYLQGSFALGDWDIDSDVDFLIAVDRNISEDELAALQVLHARIYDLDSHWAQHLEGSYFPKEILRCGDPTRQPLPYLDNTSRELTWSNHDNELVVRWVAREHGICLAGPHPHELIDPISADDLRREVWATMQDWAGEIFSGRYQVDNRWAQPFVVLSYCRMLHTLHNGRIESKPSGARWAVENLDGRWAGLIQRARQERPNPSRKVRQPADPADFESTREFVRYALERGGAYAASQAWT